MSMSTISSSTSLSSPSSSELPIEANTSTVWSEVALNAGTAPFAPLRKAISFSARHQDKEGNISRCVVSIQALRSTLTLLFGIVDVKVDDRENASHRGSRSRMAESQ